MNRRQALDTLPLSITLLFALLLRAIVAFSFPNILQPDEIFQTLEPAHRLAYGHGIVAWEFRDGLRSWVFPGVLAGVMRLTDWMGDGSSGYLAGVAVFLCLLSLIPVLVAFLWGYRTSGLVAAVLSAGICSVWFELVYFAPKAFNEVVAAHFLLAGVYLGVHRKPIQLAQRSSQSLLRSQSCAGVSPHAPNPHSVGAPSSPKGTPSPPVERTGALTVESKTRLFWAGCLCGLATALRIQLLPTLVFAVGYICRRDWRGRWLPMVSGILGPTLAFGVVDAFTWSYPFQSFLTNVWVNVVEAKSEQYGVSPWYEYLLFFTKNWLFALFPITLLAIVGTRRSPILAWLVIVIVLSHSVLAHKEYRFIYPALPMMLILVGLGTAELVTRWYLSRVMVTAVLVCLILWSSTSTILASRFDLSTTNLSTLLVTPKITQWQSFSGNLLAFKELSVEPTLCGVGLLGFDWPYSGGYTYLHRDLPIFLIRQDTDFNQLATSFNYLVTTIRVPLRHQNYVLQKCWGPTCLYKRPGSCTKIKGYHINQVLEQSGT